MVQRRNTKQRKLVLDSVRSLHNHPTADEVYVQAQQFDGHISRGTVYRNLALLAEEGQIFMVKTPGGFRYAFRTDDHAHVICTSCGTVYDFPIDVDRLQELDAQVEAVTGFSKVEHSVVFSGLCDSCRAREHSQRAAS